MRRELSELEKTLLDLIWKQGEVTADTLRISLDRPLKDSTVRTVLRRLEEKGYVQHRVDARTYYYKAVDAPEQLAAQAVRQIIDRFCRGSVEQLLVGLVDNDVLDEAQLQRLADKIAREKEKGDGR